MTDLDQKIINIQRSTRTLISFFCPIHNSLRARYHWYYKWHLSRYANIFHYLILALFMISITVTFLNINKTVKSGALIPELGSTLNSTLDSPQAKTFYDEINKVHWAFHSYSDTELVYGYSTDGNTWTHVNVIATTSSNFAITYKNISNTSYVFLTTSCNDYDICAYKGTLNSTPSVSWSGSTTVFDGDSDTNKFIKPTISLNESNYIWTASIKDTGATGDIMRYTAYAKRSTNVNDISSWNAQEAVSHNSSKMKDIILVPQTGQNIALMVNSESPNLVSYIHNGTSWSEANTGGDYSWFNFPSGGPNEGVYATLLVDGSVYIGGIFVTVGDKVCNYIAKWDGSNWSCLGNGMDNRIFALAWDGANLYAGGNFTTAGGISANYVAKWNGSAWSALGTGMNNIVESLAWDGANLYAGGNFTTAGGVSANRVAKWNGSAWSSMGSGMNGRVESLTWDGTDLYAGGGFTTAGGVTVNNIAKWNGSTWSALGTGMNGLVSALVWDGTNLYAGGQFTTAGGVSAIRIAKWNGSIWSALGTGMNGLVSALVWDGTNLYAGGDFTTAGGNSANYIAKWNGSVWSALGTGMNSFGSVKTISWDGTNLYAGGLFKIAGGIPANYIAKWDGSAWSAPGSGMNNTVYTLAWDGTNLYAGGQFTTAGGNSANYAAKWNGSVWSALGTGLNSSVIALAWDGTNLYAGGGFTTAGGVSANYIAKWNGSAWSALGTGLNSSVSALAWDGTNLYAGGDFTTAGGNSANYAAKWNGSVWSALGTGMNNPVYALAWDGTYLYTGGWFTQAGGNSANYVAKWNGSAWSALGAGMNGIVQSLAWDGTNLYAGGQFTTAGGNSANYAAKWNGSVWSALGTGLNSSVIALAWDGTNLYAGGGFTTAGGVSANYIAKWDGVNWTTLGDGANSSIYALTWNGTNLYAGGNFNLTNNQVSNHLARWGPTTADDINPEKGISTVSDSSGDIHLAYIDTNDDLIYKRFDEGTSTWQAPVTIREGTVDNTSISIRPNSDELYLAWIESSSVYYKRGSPPYASLDWDSSPTTLFNLGTNININLGSSNNSGMLFAQFTDTSAFPPSYEVRFMPINTTIVYTWDGGGDGTSWTDPDNWDRDYSYPQNLDDKVVLNSSLSSIPELSLAELTIDSSTALSLDNNLNLTKLFNSSGNLTINSDSSLNINQNDLTVEGDFTNNGTLKLFGNETIDLTPDSDSGSIEYTGTSSNFNLKSWDYYNLKINGSNSNFKINQNTTVNNDLTITDGTLSTQGYNVDIADNLTIGANTILSAQTVDSRNSTITVSNNWLNSGSFVPSTSTVILISSNPSIITGSNTFNNLSCSIAGKTIKFEANQTQTITGTTTLKGASGNFLILTREGGTGSDQWNINPQGTIDIDYVDISYSKNLSSNTIDPTNGSDSGNNTNWFPDIVPVASPTPEPTPSQESKALTTTPTPTPTPTPTSQESEQAQESDEQTTGEDNQKTFNPEPSSIITRITETISNIVSAIGETIIQVSQAIQTVSDTTAQVIVQTSTKLKQNPTTQTIAKTVLEPTTVSATVLIFSQIALSSVAVANVSTIPIFNIIPYNLFFTLLHLLGIRPKRRHSVVIDSYTGKPIPFAVVRFFDKKQNLVLSEVADQRGRFIYSLVPNEYTIKVSKENYTFPAKTKIKFSTANSNLWSYNYPYYGDSFVIKDQNQTPDFIISLDPTKQPKQNQIRKTINTFYNRFEQFMGIAGIPTLIVILVLSFIAYLTNPEQIYLLYLILFYLILILLYWLDKNIATKTYSLIIDTKTKKPIPNINVSIFDQEYMILRSNQVSDSYGRFRIYLAPGQYKLIIDDQNYEMDLNPILSPKTIHSDTIEIKRGKLLCVNVGVKAKAAEATVKAEALTTINN